MLFNLCEVVLSYFMVIISTGILVILLTGICRGTDKSPLGQKPTRTKAHWTISHWTKAHCLIWQGGQKPTSLKKRFKSFIKLLTLIRLLLQGRSHLQSVFTEIIIYPVCCDKQLNLGVKSHRYLKKINLKFGPNNLL